MFNDKFVKHFEKRSDNSCQFRYLNQIMKTTFIFKWAIAASFILLFACDKDDPGTSDPDAPQSSLTLLKSSQWKVVGKQSHLKLEGAAGGSFGTMAFTLQKPDELRWYTIYHTMSSYSDANEMIFNTRGEVTINKDLKAQAYGGQIKAFVGNDVWKVNRAEVYNRVNIFRNDQMVDPDQNPEGRNHIVRIQASEDGMLNSSETLGNNYVNHYHFATQKWKNNTFWGNNFVTFRHNGLTYVIAFTRLTSANGISIMVESDNRVEVQDPQIPSIKTVHYPMTTLQSIPGEYGFVMHASKYGDSVFVVFLGQTANNRYGVVRVNLASLTAQLVQAPEFVVPDGLDNSDVLYNLSLIEIDDAGNLYVVESRSENNEAYHSIRKYSANGGNEVVLKEQDLAVNTRIHAIKYFNGKIYAAIVNRENIPDNNPDDNSFQTLYHMQVISPK